MKQSIDRATARQVIADLDVIDRAGKLPELRAALEDVRRQWREDHVSRTIGESLRWGELGDIAARLLGIDRELCREAAGDVAGWPHVVIEVIRAVAERLSALEPTPIVPQRRRRVLA